MKTSMNRFKITSRSKNIFDKKIAFPFFKKIAIIPACIMMLLLSNVSANEKDREIKQKELDNACEVARENKLAPLRQQYIEECVKNERSDRSYCETFYSDYGERSGNRAPLFYDLPKCEEAFEYQNSYRQAK